MDDQKHYIIVDNETYELHDGNGSFYVTKANYPANPFPNTFCTVKESENIFLDNITVPISVADTTENCRSGQQLEPIIIDNYCNMNYFTQAASDVTIYLNSNNENNFIENNRPQSGYFVDSEGVIDLTKFSSKLTEKMISSSDIPERETTIDINKTIQNIGHQELDAPEFIDISKLKLSYVNTKLTNEVDILPLIKTPKNNCKTITVDLASEESDEDDDEVIFVKEFKANIKNTIKPLDLRRKDINGTKEKCFPEPRRNPKRQVQLLKESFDLALKLSDEEIYYGRIKRPYKEFGTDNSRRSNRNTGAVLSPPIALTNEDYKEWPTNGLHERPIFNMATKKIEKFDFKSADDKRKAPMKKNDINAMKPIKGKKFGKKGKRKAPNRSRSIKRESPEKGISKEFASLTHETLQEVINYVSQVKEYNAIKEGSIGGTEAHTETGSLIEDANTLLNVLRSNSVEENLNDAIDILTDSCILYSLANDVCQRSVAKYLNSVKSAKKN